MIWFSALIILFGATYYFFAFNIGLPAGKDIKPEHWLSFWGAFLSFSGSLYLGYVAIQQNKRIIENEREEFAFSVRPIIECYLSVYKLSGGTPYIVLVAENTGKSTAYNIQLKVSLPDILNQSPFFEHAKKINEQPFTLAPGAKLSTPLCLDKEKCSLKDCKIEVTGKYEYDSFSKEHQTDTIPHYTFSINEFNLFNAIDLSQPKMGHS